MRPTTRTEFAADLIEQANGVFAVIATDLAEFIEQRLLLAFTSPVVASLHDLQIFSFGVLTHGVTRFHAGNIIKCLDDTYYGNILHGLIRSIDIETSGWYNQDSQDSHIQTRSMS